MVCAKLFKPRMSDFEILNVGVAASIETKVSLTGAYDDACACYYGGFVVTDNYNKKIIHSEKCLNRVSAVIFIPKSRKRGNVRKLKASSDVFEQAWNLAKKSEYWNAMILNGLATSTILSSEPKIIPKLIENGALGASVSGNGPAIAAIVKNDNVSKIKSVFSSLEGKTTVAQINNKKAEVHEL
jgi:shikimate kinase